MTEGADPRRLILVGRIAGAFGVKGEVRVTAYTGDPAALLAYRDFKGEDGAPVLTLLSGRAAKPGPANTEIIGRAAQIPTREVAEAMRGVHLYVAREALPPPEDDDEFYLTDLIGLSAATPEGEPLGRVKAVLNHGAGDIIELDPGAGRPTRLIPFTREAVPEVRVAEGRIVVVPPIETGETERGEEG